MDYKKSLGMGYEKFPRMSYEKFPRMGYKKFLGMGYKKFLGMSYEKLSGNVSTFSPDFPVKESWEYSRIPANFRGFSAKLLPG